MNRIFFSVLVALAALCSCSPITLDITVDVRNKSELKMDLHGQPPAIVNISPRGDKDSALMTNLAFGIAEKLEEDLDMESGTVPVFSLFSEETELSDPKILPYLFTVTGHERVVVMDSLSVSDFSVERSPEKVFVNSGLYYQTVVYLPFHLDFHLFRSDSIGAEYTLSVNDSVRWTILSEEKIENVRAIARANTSITRVFTDMGKDLGSMFSPQWEEQTRMLIVYEEDDWMKAYNFASSFMWNEAMDIWLEKVKSSNPSRAAFAAYNLAVACEMTEQYDLAEEWLDLAKSKYPFSELELERRNIKEAASR